MDYHGEEISICTTEHINTRFSTKPTLTEMRLLLSVSLRLIWSRDTWIDWKVRRTTQFESFRRVTTMDVYERTYPFKEIKSIFSTA